MPCSCVRGASGRSGGTARVPVLFPPPLLPPSLAPFAVRVAGCPIRVSLSLTCWYGIPRFRGLGLVGLQVRTACSLCVCALALPRCARSPPCPCDACTSPITPAGCQYGRVRRFVPLRVSCPGPVLCLSSVGGSGPVPSSPCLAPGRALRGGRAHVAGAVLCPGVVWPRCV